MNHPKRPRILLLLPVLGLLAACGGGGSDDSAPTLQAAGTVKLTVAARQLRFDWPEVTGADHYRILVNPDGASGFRVVPAAARITSTRHSLTIPVHRSNWLSAQYLVEACDAAQSACVAFPLNNLTPVDAVAATLYVKASNSGAYDEFGRSLALSADGATLAVGAPFESGNPAGIEGNDDLSNSGAVYLYRLRDGIWSQQAYIKAANAGVDDRFGYSLALSADGNTLAVGAERERSNSTQINTGASSDAAANAGAVYVFRHGANGWRQQAYIKATNTNGGDRFGSSVALSADGNTLVAGAPLEKGNGTGTNSPQDDNSLLEAGAAYVFRYRNGAWDWQAYIKASNTGEGDQFGKAVALSADGDTLAVGAPGEDSNARVINGFQGDDPLADESGAAYVFRYRAGGWMQQAYIKPFNSGESDSFGRALALSADGNTLAVGAREEDSAAQGINGESVEDDYVAESGAAYVFRYSEGIWSQQAYVKASNTGASDYFGFSLALADNGNLLAVGAPGEAGSIVGINGDEFDDAAPFAGAVYFFRYENGGWLQKTYVKASNTDSGDWFGASVALSADGDTLAVGAGSESSGATGVGGPQTDNSAYRAGAVYLY